MKTIKILFSLIVFAGISAWAQVYNDGATVTIQTGCYTYVRSGDFNNASGTIDVIGDGRIYIYDSGNFSNTGTFNKGSGYVLLDGTGDQHIQGNATTFHYLYFRGGGTKYVDVNTNVAHYLRLEQPVSTGGNTIFYTSTSHTNVYTNGTDGFIRSTAGGGLSRVLNSTQNYEFPVGTLEEGIREVYITPEGTGSQTFRVNALSATAPSLGSVVGGIGGFNTKYYHNVDRTAGSGTNNVSFYHATGDYTSALTAVAKWNGSAWQEVPSFPATGVPRNWVIGTDISTFSPFVLFSTGSTLTVPTLSEWGLIILSLLTMTLVMLFIGRRELAVAGAGGVNTGLYSFIQSAPFSRNLYVKILSICLLIAVAGFALVHVFIGTNGILDLMGTLACSFIVAYMIHLYVEFDGFKGNS